MFEVVLSPEAEAFYANADKLLASKSARCFRQLERNPREHSNIKRLTGPRSKLLRYRVGDWRVIYRIDAQLNRVSVLTVAHRREVYE